MADAELTELLTIAEYAAARAGVTLRAKRGEWTGIAAEQGREVKVDADTRAEDMILEQLAKLAPFPVISEEAGWVAGDAGDLVWAVDPLDGSVNYIRGYPHCAVSIALLRADEPVLGVVDCFLMQERFTGHVGVGAWLNGTPMRVSTEKDPARGVLHTGIPSRMSTDADAMAKLTGRLAEWRKVRMIGSAASALACVASGRAEAYRESGSRIWDVAGGCALVLAAGGEVRIDGAGLDQPLEVSAGNGVTALLD